ncbi:MAG: DUF2085 domain-containing protein [Candidatus Altiarchaeales archaeon]|nr:MAG: DUF2085 domain-containing protein [Candidatus Altiarchaeales archaeon]
MIYKKRTYLIFLFPVLMWCFLIILAPYLMSIHREFAANLIYFLFSPVCHQLPERSFFLFGYKLAVCARCTAIYFGFLITSLIYPLFKRIDNKETPGKWLLILSLIPMGLDGGIQLVTSYESTNQIRAITGGIFGIILPLYIIPVYNTIIYEVVGWLKTRNQFNQKSS